MNANHLFNSLAKPGFVQSQLRDAVGHLRNLVTSDEYARAYRFAKPFTMSGDCRLRGLYDAVREVGQRGVAGDVVECGTARGGSAALLAKAILDSGVRRRLWVFDTFEGIPPPTLDDPDYEVAKDFTGAFRGSLEGVRGLIDRTGLADVTLVRGRFQDTLSDSAVRTIAVLHVDGDWYDSVKCCLDELFPLVSAGGIIQIDDYGHWEGARKAVDEFMKTWHLSPDLRVLDYTGRQFTKP